MDAIVWGPSGARPTAFASYASRIAWNLRANIAPLPPSPPPAAADLAGLLDGVYTDMHADPARWALPVHPIRDGDPRTRQTTAARRLSAMLGAFRTLATQAAITGGVWRTDAATWAVWRRDLRPKESVALLEGLKRVGVTIDEPAGGAELRYEASPEAWTLLADLARATSAQDHGLERWLRGDPRALAGDAPWTLEDAAASLDERDRDVLGHLDALATGLGCRFDLRAPTLWWGEYRGSYYHRQARHNLCGFAVQEGRLEIRSVHDNVAAMLPFVRTLSEAGQRRFLEQSLCGGCGGCKGREPLIAELAGQRRRLCWWGHARNTPPPYDGMDEFEALIRAQLEIYRAQISRA